MKTNWLFPISVLNVCMAFSALAESDIPQWAEDEIQSAYSRYALWKGGDVTVAIPFVTDVHSFKSDIDVNDNFADSKRHIRILRRAAEVFDADATADLGDMGIDCQGVYTEPSSAAHQAERILSQQTLYADFTRPHMAVVGNHDHGAATNKITNAQFGSYFNNPSFARSASLVTGPNRDYGYLDVPGKNARVFFLNTTDTVAGNGYGISDDQVSFLSTHLAELSNGATAFVFSHYCLHQRLGRWDEPGWKPSKITNLDATVQVIETFAARKGVHLAGVMAGDSHFNNHVETNGVKWAISQGFGGVADSSLPNDPFPASKVSFTRTSQTLIDVVAFKPATGEFRTFRIGAGGRDCDITFTNDETGDTFTWTGGGDGLKWSDPANWTTTSTTHDVPANGDRVVVKGLAAGSVVSNDIQGLSLPYLELSSASTSTPYVKFYGHEIELTGGWDAFVSRSGRFQCYIPFHLAVIGNDPTVRFDFASKKGGSSVGGRMSQYADISGPGKLYVNYPSYWSPCTDFTYTGGTICNKGTVDPIMDKNSFGDPTKPVEVRGSQFRYYNNAMTGGFPYVFNETEIRGNDSDTTHSHYFWYDPKSSGGYTGLRFAASWSNGGRTFNCPITVGRVAIFPDNQNAGNKVTFNGRVETVSFNAGFDTQTGKYYTNSAEYVFNAAGNLLGDCYVTRSRFVAGIENAFGTNTVFHPGEQSAELGTVDLRGHNQTIDRIVLNANHPISAGKPAGHVVTSSTGPATLTLAATDDCETDALFSGDLSLVWAPKQASTFSTYAAYGRAMPMTGAIVVSNGTFVVNGANCFPLVTCVEVAPGAQFDWQAVTVEPGLSSITSIAVGAGASFTIAAGATCPFRSYVSSRGLALDLAETASFVVSAGQTLAVSSLSTNGVALAANAVYSGNPAATDAVYLPQLAGGTGLISITEQPSLLVVSRNMTLSHDQYCSGVKFMGPYTLDAVPGAKVMVDEAGEGIACADGFTGTATIDCPVEIGYMGARQTIDVPAGVSLVLNGALGGNADLDVPGKGTIKLLGGGDMVGDWEFYDGPVQLGGVFTDATGFIRVTTNATLSLMNVDLAKMLRCRYQSGTCVYAEQGTTNVLRGGWRQDSQNGTPTWGFGTGNDAELTFMGPFNSGLSGIYPAFNGSGTIHMRTSEDKVGCLTLNDTVKVHVWEPMFATTRSNYDRVHASAKMYLRTENALTKSPWDIRGYLDLCGIDQTIGRLSYVSEYNGDGSLKSLNSTGAEIHSDSPSTLTLYQDSNAAGGGNAGPVIFAGCFTGNLSLIRTGASDDSKMATNAIYLAGANTATGSVTATWGLLSFTNNVVWSKKTYTGSWLNCTEAGASGKGTLELSHSKVFGRDVKIRVGTGGKIRLAPGVHQMVGGVYFDDETESRPCGTYGSSASDATFKDDTRFEGTGVLVYPNPGTSLVFR